MTHLGLKDNDTKVEHASRQAHSYELLFYKLLSLLPVVSALFRWILDDIWLNILCNLHPYQKLNNFWLEFQALLEVFLVYVYQETDTFWVSFNHFLKLKCPIIWAEVPQVVAFAVHLGIVEKWELMEAKERNEDDVIWIWQLKFHYQFSSKKSRKLRYYVFLYLFQWLSCENLSEFKLEFLWVVLWNICIIMGQFLTISW